jgi:hypothetical protein
MTILGTSTPPVKPAPIGTLGINTKSAVTEAKKGDKKSLKAARAIRYQAHSQARQILTRAAKISDPEAFPNKRYRTAGCRYVNIADVSVNHSAKFEASHYGGLQICGSVWACPICASRIQERRRLELEKLVAWAELQGLMVVLVTFTFPHRAFQTLLELLNLQKIAFHLLRQTHKYRSYMQELGFQGLVRSLEVTHGSNGWHPHTHELWLVKKPIDQSRLVKLWERACVSAGLLDTSDFRTHAAFQVHAVDVRSDVTCADYLAKQDDSRTWGIAHEVAKATSKSGRAKGVHPHHFLIRQAPGDDQHYLEYVEAMKGKRQLFWSHGLKDLAGITEKTDEELATDQEEKADVLMLLTPVQWKLVRGNDARSELLDAAETGGAPAMYLFLKSLE